MRHLSVLLLVAAAAMPVAAQHQLPAEVASIVAKHIESRGGQARWDALRSVRRVCRADTFEFTGLWAGDRARFDQFESSGGSQMIAAVAGSEGWRMMNGQAPLTLSPEAILEVKNDAAAGFELFVHAALGLTIELVGKETSGNRNVHRLRLTRRSGARMDLLLDTETGLEIARIKRIVSPDGGEQDLYMAVIDYQPAGGILFPSGIGDCGAEWSVNAPAGPELFARPR